MDFLGIDDYYSIRSRTTIFEEIGRLEILSTLEKQKNKQFVSSETGKKTIPKDHRFANILLPAVMRYEKTEQTVWVLFWRNHSFRHHYISFPGHPTVKDFITFTNHSGTICLSDK